MHFEDRLEDISSKIKTIFAQHSLDTFAKETNFIQRSTSRVNPLNFLILMVVHITLNALHSLETMTDILAKLPGGVKISAQALSKRLNRDFTVRFLRRSYSQLLQNWTSDSIKKIKQKGLLSGFNKVFIEDSTSCELNEHLAEAFKGSGGMASKAGYKIHLIWESISGHIEDLKITASSVADQSMADQILNRVGKDDLVIRDLGYFVLSVFEKIAKLGAFFLSRLKQNVKIYTVDGKEIKNLPEHIDKHFPNTSIVELNVLIGGKQKLPVRLIAYRAPEEVLNQRSRKQNRSAQKKGRTVSKKSKQWAKFTFLITNVPMEVWKAEVIGTVYRLRWDIENIFKNWKSNLEINLMEGTSRERIDCFIISRLIAIFIITMYFSLLRVYIYDKYERELSLHKFTTWLLNRERFLLIISPAFLERELIQILDTNILGLCKQKRKRLTTFELLEHSIEFLEIYP